jgi:hypothetical protein
MNVRGAILVYLDGPADTQQAALQALQAAGIAAEMSDYQLGQIEAWFTDGTEMPPRGFKEECEARAAAAAEGTGFTVVRSVLWGGSTVHAATQVIVDSETGEMQGLVDTSTRTPQEIEETKERIATALGIPVSRLELREPPQFQPPSS